MQSEKAGKPDIAPTFDNEFIDRFAYDMSHLIDTSAKNLLFTQTYRTICSDIRILSPARKYLQEKYGSPAANTHANRLLNLLNRDGIKYYIENDEALEVPSTGNFRAIIERLQNEDAELAQAMLLGYLERPTVLLAKRKEDVPGQQNVLAEAIHIGYGFIEALYDIQDQDVVYEAVKLFYDRFIDPNNPRNTLFDCINETAKYGPNDFGEEKENLAGKADIVLQALSVFTSFVLDKDVVTKFPKNFDWRKKRPSIKAIWGGEKGRSLNQIALMRQQQLFKNTLMPFADNTDSDYELHHIAFTPFSDRLANRAVQKTAQYYGEDLKKRAGYQWELVPLPQGGCIFFWWKSEGVNSEKKRELIDHELKKYLAMQKKDIFFSDLRADEMNTILDHFVPPVNNSLIATEIPILLEEVQGGLNPISVRGYLNHLRLPEEQFLRDMGFRSIKYNQVDEGVLIDVRWKWWHFRFILDRGYEAKGLKEISEAKSNWLLRTVLLYLKRIKNPPDDSGQSLIVTESLFDEENDDFPVVTEDDEEGRRFHGKRPHLKVLPFGHLPQSLDSSDIMDQMELHYKRSLRFFNGLFFQLQNNPELLDSPPEGAIKDFFETPVGKTIRAHLKKLLQNTFKKDSHPVWQKRDFVHNVPYWLLPESVGAEFNPRDPRQMFWLAFVHEAIVQGALPLNISCPGVGEEIAQVHLAGLT